MITCHPDGANYTGRNELSQATTRELTMVRDLLLFGVEWAFCWRNSIVLPNLALQLNGAS